MSVAIVANASTATITVVITMPSIIALVAEKDGVIPDQDRDNLMSELILANAHLELNTAKEAQKTDDAYDAELAAKTAYLDALKLKRATANIADALSALPV